MRYKHQLPVVGFATDIDSLVSDLETYLTTPQGHDLSNMVHLYESFHSIKLDGLNLCRHTMY